MGILDKFKKPNRPEADLICSKCGSKDFQIHVKLIPRAESSQNELEQGDMLLPVSDGVMAIPEKFECAVCGYNEYELKVTKAGELSEVDDNDLPEKR